MTSTKKEKPEQAQSRNFHNKRSALKKIIAGGGVVGTAALLPTKWTRPLVEGVILPAHAVLSCTNSLTIPGNSNSCPFGSATISLAYYSIDDVTGPCPVLVAGAQTQAANILIVDVGQGTDPVINIEINVNGLIRGATLNCTAGTGTSSDGPLTMQALSGATWNVAFTTTNTLTVDGTITHSDIVLTPA
jgi:hypothetical protein